MPTSSQALILCKNDPDRSTTQEQHQQASSTRDSLPFSVAEVYNLSDSMPLSGAGVQDNQVIRLLGRQSAQLFKYHHLPRGYTSILSFDQDTQAFRWQAIGGAESKGEGQTRPVDNGIRRRLFSASAESKGEKRITFDSSLEDQTQTVDNGIRRRPFSASAGPRARNLCHVDQFTYEQLVVLGFSKRNLVVDKSLKASPHDDVHVRQTRSGPSALTGRPKSAAVRTKSLTSYHGRENTPTGHCDENAAKARDNELDQSGTEGDDDDNDEDDDDDEILEYRDEYNRIKPSIYMRKDCPGPRPTAAVLSFRDNECSSHADVKYLIETQLGVRVSSIQYDPLNVRVDREDVRSRWIVTFKTKRDLDTAVKDGLIVGNDKIIIYRFDDLVKREVSSYKYFMTIQEAKKKLMGTKSLRTVRAIKSAQKVRNTKSSNV